MADVVCLGEALIDFVAMEAGVGVGDASGFLKAPGGAPANVAVGVARLGRTSAFLGKVGDDPFGRFLAHTFSASGVDTGGMVFDAEHRTGLAFVSLQANGERDFCFFRNPSADMTYASAELDVARIKSGRIFHYGSITLIDDTSRTTTLAALQIARDSGLIVSYDPNLRLPLWHNEDAAREGILNGLPFADILKVSAEELQFLSGEREPAISRYADIQQILRDGSALLAQFENLALLAVTLGPEGCVWLDRSGAGGNAIGQVVDAVDTTGAGDGFVAAMLVGLLEAGVTKASELSDTTVPLSRIFERANIVGAITTTSKGAIPALPDRRSVDAWFSANTRSQ